MNTSFFSEDLLSALQESVRANEILDDAKRYSQVCYGAFREAENAKSQAETRRDDAEKALKALLRKE